MRLYRLQATMDEANLESAALVEEEVEARLDQNLSRGRSRHYQAKSSHWEKMPLVKLLAKLTISVLHDNNILLRY